ncbi:MAG: TIGR02757 family protein [bacterium]
MLDTLQLDALYTRLNRREYVHPDPLECLYPYPDLHDREIVGLVASSLAYGRVAQILKSVSRVLGRMPQPFRFLMGASRASLDALYADFRHRFTTGEDLAALLYGARKAIERYGSLNACFRSGLRNEHETVLPALESFIRELSIQDTGRCNTLLPSPDKGSACKRMNLFLRWMVRRDDVDPGGWEGVPPAKLLVPLDTHLYRIGCALHFTTRRQADMKTVLDITCAFRAICPEDPVRYDFSLTRLGMRMKQGEDPSQYLSECLTQSSPSKSDLAIHRESLKP